MGDKNSVRVFAPATVANVSCAYDILGFALNTPGDEVVVTLTDTPGAAISLVTGDDGQIPTDPCKNTASVAVNALLAQLESEKGSGFKIEVHKKMPLSSGLGSSAASAAAALVGANYLLGEPFPRDALLPFAMAAEESACGVAHADNVAPALLGGFVLIRSYDPLDVVKLAPPEDLYASVVHPKIEVRTADARRILRKELSLQTAVKQWGNIAALIAGILQPDYDLIGRSLTDHIIEPERALLIPGFQEVKDSAEQAGALGSGISGSGPSIFSLSKDLETAKLVGDRMVNAFSEVGIESTPHISPINSEGPKIIEEV